MKRGHVVDALVLNDGAVHVEADDAEVPDGKPRLHFEDVDRFVVRQAPCDRAGRHRGEAAEACGIGAREDFARHEFVGEVADEIGGDAGAGKNQIKHGKPWRNEWTQFFKCSPRRMKTQTRKASWKGSGT